VSVCGLCVYACPHGQKQHPSSRACLDG
jgi:ferredoxin